MPPRYCDGGRHIRRLRVNTKTKTQHHFRVHVLRLRFVAPLYLNNFSFVIFSWILESLSIPLGSHIAFGNVDNSAWLFGGSVASVGRILFVLVRIAAGKIASRRKGTYAMLETRNFFIQRSNKISPVVGDVYANWPMANKSANTKKRHR